MTQHLRYQDAPDFTAQDWAMSPAISGPCLGRCPPRDSSSGFNTTPILGVMPEGSLNVLSPHPPPPPPPPNPPHPEDGGKGASGYSKSTLPLLGAVQQWSGSPRSRVSEKRGF